GSAQQCGSRFRGRLAQYSGNAISPFDSWVARVDSRRHVRALKQVFQDAQVVSWELYYTKQAQKDARKLASSNLRQNAEKLLDILRVDPFANPPPYEKLIGDLEEAYSRRINIQHRLVYQAYHEEK